MLQDNECYVSSVTFAILQNCVPLSIESLCKFLTNFICNKNQLNQTYLHKRDEPVLVGCKPLCHLQHRAQTWQSTPTTPFSVAEKMSTDLQFCRPGFRKKRPRNYFIYGKSHAVI